MEIPASALQLGEFQLMFAQLGMKARFGAHGVEPEPCLEVELVQVKIIICESLILCVGVLPFQAEPFQDLVENEKERPCAPIHCDDHKESACYRPCLGQYVQQVHEGSVFFIGQILRFLIT